MALSRIYTRRGDSGETSLYSGERVPKSSHRVELGGTIDELQAFLGLARATTQHKSIAATLYDLERLLVQAMTELATVGGEERITAKDVEGIEQTIDQYSAQMPASFAFATPGESPGSATLHLARTVARRCERKLDAFSREEEGEVSPTMQALFNRISDLCYILACCEDAEPSQ